MVNTMRKLIQKKLIELKEEGLKETVIVKADIKRIMENIRENDINAWFSWDQDAATQILIEATPRSTELRLSLPNFWKKYKQDTYEHLFIHISFYKKMFTSSWNIFKRGEREGIYSNNPPNKECEKLQEKIIGALEREGFTYVIPEECNETFEGKTLYSLLFDYY